MHSLGENHCITGDFTDTRRDRRATQLVAPPHTDHHSPRVGSSPGRGVEWDISDPFKINVGEELSDQDDTRSAQIASAVADFEQCPDGRVQTAEKRGMQLSRQ
jgi:hypothetical protein